jgi:hypothetical protein
MSHLYVMQNEFGFIKVGRSARVEQRRRTLESTNSCAIALVAVIEDGGDLEEAIHIALDEYRIIGEWFEGHDSARAAIIKAVGLPDSQAWPHAVAEDDASSKWLEKIEGRRAITAADKALRGLARDMTRYPESQATDTIRWYDTHIWTIPLRFEKGLNTLIFSEKGEDGTLVLVGARSDMDETEIVPFYTRDVEAAMTLWPEADRPASWNGTAWDCCIAALEARRARLPKLG